MVSATGERELFKANWGKWAKTNVQWVFRKNKVEQHISNFYQGIHWVWNSFSAICKVLLFNVQIKFSSHFTKLNHYLCSVIWSLC